MMTAAKNYWILAGSFLALAMVVLLVLMIGSARIPAGEVYAVVMHRIFGLVTATVDPSLEVIVCDIRWPRLALAIVAGSALAASGAVYQTLFRNPLADPYILGVSSGAALGAALSIAFFQSAFLTVFAFMGGCGAVAVVYALGQRWHSRDSRQLLLAGIALGAMLNAFLSCIMAVFTQQLHAIVFWLMGSLANPVDNLAALAGLVLCGILVLMIFAGDLDVLLTGEESAKLLGVNVTQVRAVSLAATTLLTSIVVAVIGIIGFVGLIVPHLARSFVGPGHKLLLPVSAVWGAILLLTADAITRYFTSLVTIPVGVVTAMLGGPFFLYVLLSLGDSKR
ncbi:FecCD family ABC transporter permease [Acetonema longum]|uniref:Transporter permease n=1 Tax=Acetonema longum DSM 6540 TaxID=1009370 RepID=F7NPU8_9FIRM|nr:iron ABC transporter permease [Acetonema longum]EGO61939.1 transporter permease [Acetonema longum DSM 6540]